MFRPGDIVQVVRDWRHQNEQYMFCETNVGMIGHVMMPGFVTPTRDGLGHGEFTVQVEFTGLHSFEHPDFMYQTGRYATHVEYIPPDCLKIIGYSIPEIHPDNYPVPPGYRGSFRAAR